MVCCCLMVDLVILTAKDGSVVTKDIPSHVVAAGNPCKIIRAITVDDKKKWENVLKEEKAIK